MDPNHASAYKTRGYLNNELGKFQACIKDYQKFLQLNGPDPTIYHAIAICYQRLGNRQEALKAVNEAIRLNPNANEYKQLKQSL